MNTPPATHEQSEFRFGFSIDGIEIPWLPVPPPDDLNPPEDIPEKVECIQNQQLIPYYSVVRALPDVLPHREIFMELPPRNSKFGPLVTNVNGKVSLISGWSSLSEVKKAAVMEEVKVRDHNRVMEMVADTKNHWQAQRDAALKRATENVDNSNLEDVMVHRKERKVVVNEAENKGWGCIIS